MVCDGLGEGLEELLLGLELPGHGAGPPVPLLGVLGLADEGEGGALAAGRPHPEHLVLGVGLDLLLELHIVNLKWNLY